jgi:transcriptional regulator with XRE-family HTH domain
MDARSPQDATELGARLRAARVARRWSLADVAGRAGLSRAYISALELGRSKRPGADALRRLEDVVGPLGDRPTGPPGIPTGLLALASERSLPDAELRMLAGLRIRGRRPVSPERWRFIYDALVASESMDDSATEKANWAPDPTASDPGPG